VQRDFSARRPDRLWLADFTYLRCWEGVVFFSFVIDCFSRMIVGWQFAGHMRTELVSDALAMAVAIRQPHEAALLIHHSDRGSQLRLNRSSQHWLIRGNLGAESDGFSWRRRDGSRCPTSRLRGRV
jgi:putative transposase